ncbi:MAG: hypothetical protein HQ592_00925 [Planctomycetes bacterium]|nr:hypothetical protein [Planctomycetota bacterium]
MADWMEIQALQAPDGDVSRGDLVSTLRREGLFRTFTQDSDIEELILAVFNELESRSKATRDAYPFQVNGPVLQTIGDWKKHPVYVFCLCLSYFGCKEKKGTEAPPRRWFEHISRDAATQYLSGEGVRFGSPRVAKEIPTAFKSAVEHLCKCLREGDGYKKGGLKNAKDDGVDIVAWKHFPDGLPGKLILFGNCASGKNWDASKRRELDPHSFCLDWMHNPPSSPIIRSFFIPHRIEREDLASHSRRAGIIFDRCRIAYYASRQTRPSQYFEQKELVEWTEDQLSCTLN